MGILPFAVLKIRMNDRKSREKFLSDIDCDLLQYPGELRKKEFTLDPRHGTLDP